MIPSVAPPSPGQAKRVPYDALLVAVGARSEPALRRALTWDAEADAELFGGLLRDLDEGYAKRVAFVVPPGVAWALPAYELAMMTAWQAWGMGHDDIEVTVYTPEDAPLGLFGTRPTADSREGTWRRQGFMQAGVYVTAGSSRTPAGWFCCRASDRSMSTASSPCRGRSDRRCPDFRRTLAGSCPPTFTGRVPDVDRVWAAGGRDCLSRQTGRSRGPAGGCCGRGDRGGGRCGRCAAAFSPGAPGMMLTGRGKAWMRHAPAGDGEGSAERRALWWPPTKIAGRYLSPYLAARQESDAVGTHSNPTVNRSTPTSSSRFRLSPTRSRQARLRGEDERARLRQRRAEAFRETRPPS